MMINRFLKVFLVLYSIVMVVYATAYEPNVYGEWDDYSFPAVSILNDGNITISKSDIEYARELFPKWNNAIDNYHLSGFAARDGNELTYYFPTYSAMCIPMILLLKQVSIPNEYAFAYTNIISIILMCLVIIYKINVSDKKKLILLLILTLNPIVFYYSWISAEVFMYSFLAIALLLWLNKDYKLSAMCLTFVGTTNGTMMTVGFVMVADYLYNSYKDANTNKIIQWVKIKYQDILLYFSCYLPSLIPYIYSYYQIGHPNIVAAIPGMVNGNPEITLLDRILAYFFDLNFGFISYYLPVLIISSIMLIYSFIQKNYRFLFTIIAFIITVSLYSLHTHVNSGMSGIARYNVWGILVLLVPVVYEYNLILENRMKYFAKICLVFTIILNVLIINRFGLHMADKYPYTYFTPIAKYVLKYCPEYYNPLPTTFFNRIIHKDYDIMEGIDTALIYSDDDRYVRKIYASKLDFIKNEFILSGKENDVKWLNNKLEELQTNREYVSIPYDKKISMYVANEYSLGTPIMFYGDNYNADKYVIEGISGKEDSHSWTLGNNLVMTIAIPERSLKKIKGTVKLRGVLGKQHCNIFVNSESISEIDLEDKCQNVEFVFNTNAHGQAVIKFDLPNAHKPNNGDQRVLSLAIEKIIFSEI